MKALKKTQSEAKPHPCPENSSPESVKRKAISTNLKKKLSKKRKQVVDEPLPKDGLKLLKRGAVTMHRIVRRKILGLKLPVMFNAKGEPYGQAGAEMQSYIGVLARTKPPIWYDTWKKVPKERKTKIWDCVQMAYDVPSSARKMVLQSACQKWREFKSKLTTKYVLPHRDQLNLLESPPADYSFIEKAHWDMFVATRLSPEFLAIHDTQKMRRLKNSYPHRISRKGYANLEEELIADRISKSLMSESKEEPDLEIDRSTTWLEARKDEDGDLVTDELKTIASNIETMKQRVADGELTEEGTDDVLTMVLGKPEHPGRVRGQGTRVKPSVYFDLPRKKKAKTIKDKIQEGIQQFMSEETSRIINERDAYWAEEIKKLKAIFCVKNTGTDSSPNLGSQQGSCCKDGPANKELELQNGAKKKLDLVDVVLLEEEKQDEKKTEVENVCKEADQVITPVLPVGGCLEWELAIGSRTNVVAYAIIDTVSDVLHGKPLPKENARVSITRVIQGAVEIPFPINDEIVTVEQALGTYIAWPRDLILEVNTSSVQVNPTPTPTPKKSKKNSAKKFKLMKECLSNPEAEYNMGADYPPSLKRLWVWANEALKDGLSYSFKLCEEAFGSTQKQVLFLSDVQALCFGGEISGSTICIYIHLLEEYLKKHKMNDMVAFVDPGTIGYTGCGNSAQRSRVLSNRFKNAKPGQYFMLPYNHLNHWALTVVNPEAQVVYHMDPLRRRIGSDEWIEVVDNGVKLYKDKAKKISKKKIPWENMAGVPFQQGTKDCGLFVMRFMKEICEDKEFNFANKWARRSNLAYSTSDINEIKTDLAKFFMKHYAS